MGFTQEKELHRKVLLISTLCVLGAGASAYYLYEDLNSTGDEGTGSPVGHVVRFESKVKRKAVRGFTWKNVREEQPLFRKDSIQTGPGSAVVFNLNDGTTLEMGEQSLVVLDNLSDLSLNFMRGTGIVHGKDGDSQLSVGEDGKAKIEKLPVRALSPAAYTEFFTADGAPKPVAFQWEATESGAPLSDLSIQISSDGTFRKSTTKSYPVAGGPKWQYEAKLNPGRYAWRILQKSQSIAPPRNFRVIAARPLRPASPSHGEILARWGSTGPVTFQWSALKDGTRSVEHFLDLATDAGFTQGLRTEKVDAETGSFQLMNVADGEYYWRLRSTYPDLPQTSTAERFSLKPKKQMAIALTYPEAKASIEIRSEIRFSWQGEIHDGLAYRWELEQLSADGSSRPGATLSSSAPTAAWKQPAPGRYRWRVSALLGTQEVGKSAGWREFSVYEGKPLVLTAPTDRQLIQYWDKPETFAFEWTGEKKTGEYLLELANDPEFTKIVKTHKGNATRVTSPELGFQPGSYYWRVRVIEADGFTSRTSRTWSFTYGQYPPLTAPALAGPNQGQRFNPLQKEENPVLSWTRVEGATGYEVLIYRDDARGPASSEPFQRQSTKDTTLEIKGLKQEGTYRWTVRPIDRIQRPGEAAPKKAFEFTYGARLRAPKIRAPEVQ